MKYTCSIEINLPLKETAELWNDESHFSKWQDGFKSIELLSGNKHEKGAKSRIILIGKQRIELTETIILNDLPTEKIALYEHIHMNNTQHTQFTSIDATRTLYTSTVEYTLFKKRLIKLIAKLFPGMFRKQSEKWLKQFKIFAENHAKNKID